jgi:hypothetical protein
MAGLENCNDSDGLILGFSIEIMLVEEDDYV